ncbi:hypothetical protein [Spirillospora albida]|uniref:hypothetical protein n=1 Tax=Spirillospora albida TaxID=58123 RepID=UPI0004C2AB35|nr:hypothetical protein [Spirillospora albida]
MTTPSTPGKGASAIRDAAGSAAGNAKTTAQDTAETAGRTGAQAGGHVVALPGRVAGLTKLLTLRRLLRAVPIAAAAGAGLAVGRLTARKR